ncbi:MAG: hypothetical protein R3F07_10440 [Opitutaceae bacterium]
MRTTLTLDPDVAERLRQETASGRRSFKEVVNERLRVGLGLVVEEPHTPYRVKPHASPFQPGVDSGKLNQLVDELEAGSALGRMKRASRK